MKDSSICIEWSKETLYTKARLFAEQMESYSGNDWRIAFWSALSLELVGRAALAHISPVLIAEPKNFHNLLFALGKDPVDRTARRSIGTEEVFKRLLKLVPTFNDEMFRFSLTHLQRRNEELHTGAIAFAQLSTSDWLPKFYWVCDILLDSMDESLAEFIADPRAPELINSLGERASIEIKISIDNHAAVWGELPFEERVAAASQAKVWASRRNGHRVKCPACNCTALLFGEPHGRVVTEATDDEITQRQTFLPSRFQCVACRLRILGHSKLMACGLGDTFTSTTVTSPVEFYGLFTEDDLEAARDQASVDALEMFEDNFND